MSATPTVESSPVLASLAAADVGEVLVASDGRYEQARKVWNAMIDGHPLAIVRCGSAAQVAAVVGVAREHRVQLAIRGGGHSVAGFSSSDGGLVIDLGRQRGVKVDVVARRAIAGGGATWADLDAAAQLHSLATTGGLVSTTGVGGLTLGGGIGWLTRAFGLACDNVVSAEVVTAGGEIVRASEDENPDLFWGLRGGGGNFGVVTSFEFALHPVNDVTAAFLLWPLAAAPAVAEAYREWVGGLPDEFSTMLVYLTGPDMDGVPEELRGRPAVALLGCHIGQETDAADDLVRIREIEGAADLTGRVSYLELQQMFDSDLPPGRRYYFAGAFFDELSDEMLEVLRRASEHRPSPECEIDLHHMGGAAGRVAADATAFANRAALYTMNAYACWDDTADDEAHRAWARGVRDACAPFAVSTSYVNFTSEAGSAAEVQRTYGDRYTRLQELKRRWDPTNLFALNQNIRP